ncbi:MAG TPA: nickel pincer cofactor biosynthesis protein LarC [Vicinamibacterales bacterium]|jgi:uncharacterized protein (TIGR00299 family) protein|nr:nickel pincer cofactor biosynthesis protein LarC [Vicinamibacterales bacterium]
MSRVLYFDCFSGISGDMVLGAMIDLGLPLADLQAALGSLALGRVELRAKKVLRAGVSATKFSVSGDSTGHEHAHSHESHSHEHGHAHSHPHSHEHVPQERPHSQQHEHSHAPGSEVQHGHRSIAEIGGLIDRSSLSASGRLRAKQLFQALAEVEASIHQMPVEKVHLHEVGALDSIIDIVGTVFAMEWAGADRVVCSPLNVGGGMVDTAHGHFPVPAPATLALLNRRNVPVYSGPVKNELVTPTGALIAVSYAEAFGALPSLAVERVGYGAGDRDPKESPNVLRVIMGRAAARAADRAVVIECEIDDMNPQIFGVIMDRLYTVGALEVFYAPVQMKKNRPGTLVTVIAPPDKREAMVSELFRETTTIGVRYAEVDRECLRREMLDVTTPFGTVRFKLAWRGDALVNAAPEFEDCARLAAEHKVPVKEVQAAAIHAYGARS